MAVKNYIFIAFAFAIVLSGCTKTSQDQPQTGASKQPAEQNSQTTSIQTQDLNSQAENQVNVNASQEGVNVKNGQVEVNGVKVGPNGVEMDNEYGKVNINSDGASINLENQQINVKNGQVEANGIKVNQEEIENDEKKVNLNNSNQKDNLTKDTNSNKKLTVNNRCIGCGKCVRIDPEHFKMSGDVAVVISQENLNSPKLRQAIENCPSGAIELN